MSIALSDMNIFYDSVLKKLFFNGKPFEGSIRFLDDMKDVIYDRELSGGQSPKRELYYMFRDICKDEKDKDAVVENSLRYDITVIPPCFIGEEFVKTQGHAHSLVVGTDITYPEMYQILSGQAIYVFEKRDGEQIHTYYVCGNKGDIVIVPPDYSHVTVNPSVDETLIMANWVERNFQSVYEPILKSHGLGFYYVRDCDGKDLFIENPSNNTFAELQELKPINPELIGLEEGESMYHLVERPEQLEFLVKPQNYGEMFMEALKSV